MKLSHRIVLNPRPRWVWKQFRSYQQFLIYCAQKHLQAGKGVPYDWILAASRCGYLRLARYLQCYRQIGKLSGVEAYTNQTVLMNARRDCCRGFKLFTLSGAPLHETAYDASALQFATVRCVKCVQLCIAFGISIQSKTLSDEENYIHQYRKGDSKDHILWNEYKIRRKVRFVYRENPNLDGIGKLINKDPAVLAGFFKNETALNIILRNGYYMPKSAGVERYEMVKQSMLSRPIATINKYIPILGWQSTPITDIIDAFYKRS